MSPTCRISWAWVGRVFVPLGIGILVYVALRDSSTLALDWLGQIETGDFVVHSVRSPAHQYSGALPGWMIMNLPDGLWVFSFTSAIRLIWNGNRSPEARWWVCVPLVLGLGIEVLQYTGWFSGTGDWLDVFSYTIGFLAAIVLPVSERRGLSSCGSFATSRVP